MGSAVPQSPGGAVTARSTQPSLRSRGLLQPGARYDGSPGVAAEAGAGAGGSARGWAPGRGALGGRGAGGSVGGAAGPPGPPG